MSLRATFFKPRWQHRDAEIRAEAIRTMQDSELLQALDGIALDDSDAGVRSAAILRCQSLQTLLDVSQSDSDNSNRKQATQRLIKLLCQPRLPDNASQVTRDLLATEPAGDSREQLASQASDSDIRKLALQTISKPGFLGDRVLQEREPELAKLALNAIDRIATLERIAGQLRKTSKMLYQMAQERIDELTPAPTDPSSQADSKPTSNRNKRDRAARICEQLENQVREAGSHDLSSALRDAEQAWQPLQPLDVGLQKRFDNITTIIRQVLSGEVPRTEEMSDPATTESDIGTTADEQQHEQAQHPLQELAKQLNEILKHNVFSRNTDKAIDRWRDQWRQQWGKLEQPSKADQQIQEHLKNRLIQRDEAIAARAADSQAQQQALQTALDECLQAAEDGHLQQATSKRGSIDSLIDEYRLRPAQQQQRQLKDIDHQLGELRKWQRWSDNEQRARLIKKIETALDSELSADALVTLVKQCRQRWQDMEKLEVSNGMRKLDRGHTLSRQFNGVSGKAMAQARPFLEKRGIVQQEREKVVNELLEETTAILNRSESSSQDLIQQKRRVGKMFHELGGIPPKRRKAVAGSLRAFQQKISDQLTQKFADTEVEKRKLIRQAQQLEHATDQADAINQAKRLQQQWKAVGPTSRKVDQELWQAFREPIDPLFAEQKQHREQQQAERAEARQDHARLCEEMQQLADLEDARLPENEARADGLDNQWQQLNVFDTKLRQRFSKAHQTFMQRLQDARQQQRKQQWQALADKAEACQQAVADSSSIDTSQLPEELQKLDAAELQQQLETRSATARQLCIAAEFMAGLPSPKPDQNARMQYQVDRLAERMSSGGNDEPIDELRELRSQWYATLPIRPQDYKALDKRFQTAITTAESIIA